MVAPHRAYTPPEREIPADTEDTGDETRESIRAQSTAQVGSHGESGVCFMDTLVMTAPTVENGPAAWRIARDSGVLDVNSSYSYLLWFREFARTSAVALRSGGAPVGFVTGFHRPEQPGTLAVWQIAVDRERRGHGVASALLDHLADRLTAIGALRYLETTIGADNTASDRLFRSFAERHAAPLERDVLFPAELFPDTHEAEFLYRIGPLGRQTA